MPSVALHTTRSVVHEVGNTVSNNLPNLLRTPSGLAILELQGTIHAPFPQPENQAADLNQSAIETPIGRIEFPLFNPTSDPNDLKWMKRVYLYVGKHQRLTGEVKKLPKALMVIGKRAEPASDHQMTTEDVITQQAEELEILEVIRYKILFGGRPEPVGD